MRFIPAGAGNTLVFVLITRFSTVYPRWRGEHFKLPTGQEIHIGLSPLARGTRGTTRQRRWWGSVYPRWRGEH